MASGNHHETELKFLIEYPDIPTLEAQPGCVIWEIEQTYLLSPDPDQRRRVRRVCVNGETRYFRTFKRRLSPLTADEDEGEITAADYQAFLKDADPERRTILKTRYRIPYKGHTLEFDVYPFWKRQAVLEIELEDESVQPAIPPYAVIIRDVSEDADYKNYALSQAVPEESC